MKRFLFLILIIGLGAGSYYYYTIYNQKNKLIKVQTTEATFTISAKKLAKEYKSNEIAADQRYKGKVGIIKGKIKNISEVLGNKTINFKLGGFVNLVRVVCKIADSSFDQLLTLKAGRNIKVKGIIQGFTGGGNAGSIDIIACEIL